MNEKEALYFQSINTNYANNIGVKLISHIMKLWGKSG